MSSDTRSHLVPAIQILQDDRPTESQVHFTFVDTPADVQRLIDYWNSTNTLLGALKTRVVNLTFTGSYLPVQFDVKLEQFRPKSVFDIPPVPRSMSWFHTERTYKYGEWLSRGEAIAQLIDTNSQTLKRLEKGWKGDWSCQMPDGSTAGHYIDWAMLIEFGQPFEESSCDFTLNRAIGDVVVHLTLPIRMVTPSADEMRRLAR